MSVYSNHVRTGSSDSDRIHADEYENESNSKREKLPNIVPEVDLQYSILFHFLSYLVIKTYSKTSSKYVSLHYGNVWKRNVLHLDEFLLNIHVRNVEYYEYGCPRLTGTLYMSIFRLVFAPDNEIENNPFVRISLLLN